MSEEKREPPQPLTGQDEEGTAEVSVAGDLILTELQKGLEAITAASDVRDAPYVHPSYPGESCYSIMRGVDPRSDEYFVEIRYIYQGIRERNAIDINRDGSVTGCTHVQGNTLGMDPRAAEAQVEMLLRYCKDNPPEEAYRKPGFQVS